MGASRRVVLGLSVVWYHATAGLDLAMFTDKGEFTVMGVAFTGKIYAILTPVAALQPIDDHPGNRRRYPRGRFDVRQYG